MRQREQGLVFGSHDSVAVTRYEFHASGALLSIACIFWLAVAGTCGGKMRNLVKPALVLACLAVVAPGVAHALAPATSTSAKQKLTIVYETMSSVTVITDVSAPCMCPICTGRMPDRFPR